MTMKAMISAAVSRRNKAMAATVFPVVSGYHLEGARVEDLIIDGNKVENLALNGCENANLVT